MWKCFHMEVDLGLSGVFELARDVGTRGHAYILSIPVCRSELGRKTFGVRVVRKWNSLPPCVVNGQNLETFKRRLETFLGDEVFGHS